MLRNDLEYIVHCESDGTVIWPLSKIHWHYTWVRENLTHYSTWSMVYNPILRTYWIQLKNPKKQDSSTWWKRDMWVAGHNCYTQVNWNREYMSFEDTLTKEAREEIWLRIQISNDINSFKWIAERGKTTWYIFERFLYETERNSEYVWLGLICTTQENLVYTDNEVVDFQRLTEQDLDQFIATRDDYCSPLLLVFTKVKKFIITLWI